MKRLKGKLTIVLGPNVTTLAGWAKDNPHTWLAAVGPCESINGPESGQTGRIPKVAANRTEVGQLDRGLYPAGNWAGSGQVARGPLSVAEGGNPSPAGTSGTPMGEKVADEVELGQHPFWALLMAVGYEEV